MKKLFLLCCITAVIIVCVVARVTKYNQFHDAEINGKLESVYRNRDYVMISVNGEEFRIIPVSLSTTANFDEVAKVGDTISKMAGSDKFNLIHEEDEVFLYTVRKYW
ncbi:hypothetical protein FHW88_001440 [Mucilaginibacter sp. SG538B]|uniref:hypothetical protein n=1 Tax=Mucilaginibacter sp. SG538B TaxID=2587021 RepID=UPI00159DB52E|nr:hypothetical protein [Mucilaginibacter sp. SG538B]NVM63164.1 hypothetical protein [Mucilaginibacter sp. SG538B]